MPVILWNDIGDLKSLPLGCGILSHTRLAWKIKFPLVIFMGPVVNCCSPSPSLTPLILGHTATKPKDATLSHSAPPAWWEHQNFSGPKSQVPAQRTWRHKIFITSLKSSGVRNTASCSPLKYSNLNTRGSISLAKPSPKNAPRKFFLNCRISAIRQQRISAINSNEYVLRH